MIHTASVAQTGRKEFVPDHPKFLLEPPAIVPFLVTAPLSLTEYEEGFDVKWVEPSLLAAQVQRADSVLSDLIRRTRREAQRHPSSVRAHINLGLALLNVSSYDEAARELEKAIALEPSNYIARANLARVQLLQGDWERARKLYEQLTNDYPDQAVPWMSLAHIKARGGDLEEAVRLFRKAASLRKTAALPRYLLAMVLLRLGNWREAISQLKVAARLEVRSPAMHQALGVAYAMAGHLKRAARSFQAALTLLPDMAEAVQGLAEVFLKQGHPDRVIHLLSDYLARVPRDSVARELLAQAYRDQKDYRLARAELRRAFESIEGVDEVAQLDRSVIANNIGVCFALLGEQRQATEWYLRAIKLHPLGTPDKYHNLARVFLAARHFQDAYELLTGTVSLFPRDADTRVLLAVSLVEMGRHSDAVEELRTLVGRDEGSAEAYAMLGALLADQVRDLEGALDILREGRERTPDHVLLRNNLAYVHLMRGETAQARDILASVQDHEVHDDMVAVLKATRGLLAIWEGKLEEGKSRYQEGERAAKHAGKRELARAIRQKMHLELARAYRRLDDRNAAKLEAQRGLSIDGQESYREDLRALRDAIEADTHVEESVTTE